MGQRERTSRRRPSRFVDQPGAPASGSRPNPRRHHLAQGGCARGRRRPHAGITSYELLFQGGAVLQAVIFAEPFIIDPALYSRCANLGAPPSNGAGIAFDFAGIFGRDLVFVYHRRPPFMGAGRRGNTASTSPARIEVDIRLPAWPAGTAST